MELTAICDRELTSGAPDWVHLFPAGQMTGRDGRHFNLSHPQTVINAFNEGGIDLPIDYEHQNDKRPVQGGPVPAAGWIKDLKADEAGLWGRVEWTAQASELIDAKAYRYLSPSFLYEQAGKVIVRLKGAGLVHTPNLHLQALASQEDDMSVDTQLLNRFSKALSLPSGADERAVLDAIAALIERTRKSGAQMTELSPAAQQPDPARFVPIEAVQHLMQDRHQAHAALCQKRAEAKVKDAFDRGYFTSQPMRDWATALCIQDESSFDTFIAKSIPPFAHLLTPLLPDTPPPSAEHTLNSSLTSSVCSQLGLAPDALAE